MPRPRPGDHIAPLQLTSIDGQTVSIPDGQALTHLQFRRFAGCPMCNLHIHSFVRRHTELAQAGIQEVAVFHSSQAALRAQHAQAPFALIADPHKALYRQFGIETSWRSVLDPRAWRAAVQGLLQHGLKLPTRGESVLGMPADFLIAPGGRVVAAHHGAHADDQWSLDELLALAKNHGQGTDRRPG